MGVGLVMGEHGCSVTTRRDFVRRLHKGGFNPPLVFFAGGEDVKGYGWVGADFRYCFFDDLYIDVNFAQCDFRQAEFRDCRLHGHTMSDCDVTATQFTHARLSYLYVNQTDLRRALFVNVEYRGATRIDGLGVMDWVSENIDPELLRMHYYEDDLSWAPDLSPL